MAEKTDPKSDTIDKTADMKLKHTVGGSTTRDDALDSGVPMLAGDSAEPQGPEDAFGPGPKRGDYTGRQADGAEHFEAVAVVDPEPGEPTSRLVAQLPRVQDIGEVPKQKGGVSTG